MRKALRHLPPTTRAGDRAATARPAPRTAPGKHQVLLLFSYRTPHVSENQLQDAKCSAPMLLGHHVWAEARLFEQGHQLIGIVDMQRVVFDGPRQNLCRSVEILWCSSG